MAAKVAAMEASSALLPPGLLSTSITQIRKKCTPIKHKQLTRNAGWVHSWVASAVSRQLDRAGDFRNCDLRWLGRHRVPAQESRLRKRKQGSRCELTLPRRCSSWAPRVRAASASGTPSWLCCGSKPFRCPLCTLSMGIGIAVAVKHEYTSFKWVLSMSSFGCGNLAICAVFSHWRLNQNWQNEQNTEKMTEARWW